ncbi:49f647a3-f0b6-469d-a7f4-b1acf5a18e15 [Thermothielavioides terrestris]
MIFIA